MPQGIGAMRVKHESNKECPHFTALCRGHTEEGNGLTIGHASKRTPPSRLWGNAPPRPPFRTAHTPPPLYKLRQCPKIIRSLRLP